MELPAARGKAAVNAPQSKRFAWFEDARQSRQRLECGGFSTAFTLFQYDNCCQLPIRDTQTARLRYGTAILNSVSGGLPTCRYDPSARNTRYWCVHGSIRQAAR
jgi:hypothetical protein